MAFDSTLKINAPLKKFMAQINAINNARQNIGKSYSLKPLYGNSVYMRYNNLSQYGGAEMRGAYKSFKGQVHISGVAKESSSYANTGLIDYLNTLDWRDPRGGIIAYVTVKKVSELGLTYTTASDIYTAHEMGFNIYDTEGSKIVATEAFGNVIDTRFSADLAAYTYANAKPLSAYNDWYIITSVDYYGGNELPREKLTKVYPQVFLGAGQSVCATTAPDKTMIDVSGTAGILQIGTVFDPTKRQTLGQSSGTTISGLSKLSQEFWYMLGDVIISNNLYKNYNYLGINAYATTDKIIKTEYGFKLILCHNNDNGAPVTSDVLTDRGAGFVDGDIMRLPLNSNCYQRLRLVFPSIQSIYDMFADFGIAATTDLSIAVNFPINTFPDVDISAGYDTNPDPAIDSYPDNSTHDFTITPPLLSYNPAVDTTVFNSGNVDGLMRWLTTSTFFDNISRLFNDPLSAIIALRYYPFDIVNHDSDNVAYSDSIKIVNVPVDGVTGYAIADNYNNIITGGAFEYMAYYGNFADWTNCRYQLYIPYVGIVDISPSYVINRRLELYYIVDFLTGKTTAVVKSIDKDTNIGNIVLMRECSLSVDVPITYSNYNQQQLTRTLSVLSGVQSTVSGAANGAKTGGATGAAVGAAGGLVGGIKSALDTYINTPLEMGAVGTIGSSGGYNLPQTAYLMVSKKPLAIPAEGFAAIAGRSASVYQTIGSVSGFVKCDDVRLDVDCTDREKGEILTALSSGVYL